MKGAFCLPAGGFYFGEGGAKMKVGIIGAGLVGSAMALKLYRRQGYELKIIASRSVAKAEALAARVGAVAGTSREVVKTCELVLIATPDRVIEPLVSQLAADCYEGQVLAHFSGSLAAEIMAPVRLRGAQCLSLHPLQAFASLETAVAALDGTHFTVEGDRTELGCQLVKDLGGIPHRLDPERKVLYHAAACFASNYLVVLAAVATDLLERSGFGAEDGLAALLPLMRGTLANLETVGLPQALTGPIARGETAVVGAQAHNMPPEYLPLYRQLGSLAVALAAAKKTIGEAEKTKLLELLQSKAEGES
jgi:predicted short-subunit dehydrogenase-like oxidoreductase (DUF2520 family)